MDTIIYVYLRRDYKKADEGQDVSAPQSNWPYQRQDFDMGDYRLVRVGVSEELWRILQERTSEETGNVTSSPKQFLMPWRRLQERRQKRIAEANRQMKLLEEANQRQDFVKELLEDRDHSYFVAEEPVTFLEGWAFRGYREEEWVMHMMQYASLNHFVILGKAACIPRLLLQYVAKMKSLKWILPERLFGESEQELVEEVYEEFGLAIEVCLLDTETDYRRMRMACRFPTVILDFCEEERIATADVAKGSIWLDMTSSEGKRHRLEERNTGITYFSLKKEWKQPEKALYYLDTTIKNGYNT